MRKIIAILTLVVTILSSALTVNAAAKETFQLDYSRLSPYILEYPTAQDIIGADGYNLKDYERFYYDNLYWTVANEINAYRSQLGLPQANFVNTNQQVANDIANQFLYKDPWKIRPMNNSGYRMVYAVTHIGHADGKGALIGDMLTGITDGLSNETMYPYLYAQNLSMQVLWGTRGRIVIVLVY